MQTHSKPLIRTSLGPRRYAVFSFGATDDPLQNMAREMEILDAIIGEARHDEPTVPITGGISMSLIEVEAIAARGEGAGILK